MILKKARVMEIFYEYDLLITLPITKDHAGNRFTGTLKKHDGAQLAQDQPHLPHRQLQERRHRAPGTSALPT